MHKYHTSHNEQQINRVITTPGQLITHDCHLVLLLIDSQCTMTQHSDKNNERSFINTALKLQVIKFHRVYERVAVALIRIAKWLGGGVNDRRLTINIPIMYRNIRPEIGGQPSSYRDTKRLVQPSRHRIQTDRNSLLVIEIRTDRDSLLDTEIQTDRNSLLDTEIQRDWNSLLDTWYKHTGTAFYIQDTNRPRQPSRQYTQDTKRQKQPYR